MTRDFAAIDRDLEALGSAPRDVRALVTRYVGEGLSLANVDAMLSELQSGVTLAVPPRLQPTMVDEPAPKAEAAVAAAPAAAPVLPSLPQAVEAAVSLPRARMPWDSEAPDPELELSAAPVSMPAAEPAAEPTAASADLDFDALFGSGSEPASQPVLGKSSLPPSAAMADEALTSVSSRPPPRKRHDTVRDVPSPFAKLLGGEPALELDELEKTMSQPALPSKPPLSVVPPGFDAPLEPAEEAEAKPAESEVPEPIVEED
ncbi:MAG TPA: hypothetical protein VHM19_00830, partial [Polyangiales bacterium]|nr:hypothetical protein [Polyangiales bacterium]